MLGTFVEPRHGLFPVPEFDISAFIHRVWKSKDCRQVSFHCFSFSSSVEDDSNVGGRGAHTALGTAFGRGTDVACFCSSCPLDLTASRRTFSDNLRNPVRGKREAGFPA